MSRLKHLRRRYEQEQFFPSWLGLIVNPFYFARKGLATGIRKLAGQIGGELLDVGCGSKPYASLFSVQHYVGLEYDSPANRRRAIADVYYDGGRFPFEDARFDCVVASQVFEHVFNPEGFLAEIHRVLRPGGKLLLSVPFVWDEHEQPYDFARYSSFGLKHLLQEAGFDVLEHTKSMTGGGALFQLINAYLYKVTRSDSRVWNWLCMLLLMAPVNLLGCLLCKALPDNPDLYLDNIVLASRRESS